MSVIKALAEETGAHLLNEVLKQGASIHEQDSEGYTALHLAIMNNMDQEVFDVLLKYGASLTKQVNKETIPLHCIKQEFLEPILKLLRAEKKFPIREENGNTIMHLLLGSMGDGIFDIIEVINEANLTSEGEPDFSEIDKQIEGLWQAILAERNALHIDPGIQNKEGKTMLHMAAESRFGPNHLKVLLSEFCEVSPLALDKDGNTFLHIYLSEYKIKEYEDLDKNLLQGQYASCPKEVVKKLLCIQNKRGETPVYLYFGNVDNSIRVEVLSLFAEAGADFCLANNWGETVLHKVFRDIREHVFDDSEEEDIEGKITFLVKHGAEVNRQNSFGNSPIFYAMNSEGTLSLIDNGASLSIQNKSKQTPLLWHMCRTNPDNKIVEALLSAGSDVNDKDMQGNTVLHYAAWNGLNEEILTTLKTHGARCLPDDQGNLPCNVAAQFGHGLFLNIFCQCSPGQHCTTWCQQKVLSLNEIKDPAGNAILSLKKDLVNHHGRDLSKLLDIHGLGKVNWEKEETSIKVAVTDIVQRICTKLSEENSLFSGVLIQSGSVGEGTKIGHPDEFDFVYIFDKLSNMLIVDKEAALSDPSFVQFKKADNVKCTKLDTYVGTDGFIETAEIWQDFFAEAMKLIEDPTIINQLNVWPHYENFYSAFSSQDPTFQLGVKWIGQIYKALLIDIDLVPAIQTKGYWPEGARLGPLFGNPNQIREKGALTLLQTNDPLSSNFRLSALLAEKSLMLGLPKLAKDAYITAKVLVKNEICPQIDTFAKLCAKDYITSYMLKTSLLHVLEEEEQLIADNKATDEQSTELKALVKKLFQKYLQYTYTEYLPSFVLSWQNVFTFKLSHQPNVTENHQRCCYQRLFIKMILSMLGEHEDFGDTDEAVLMDDKYYWSRKFKPPTPSDGTDPDSDSESDSDSERTKSLSS